MKISTRVLFILIVIFLMTVPACNFLITVTPTEQSNSDSIVPTTISENRAQALLYVDGYGYEYGDIVLLDTESSPKVGDVLLYNSRLNNSDLGVFGPKYLLVKVIALPGDNVVFKEWSYRANGYNILLENYEQRETMNVLWGTTIYKDLNGLTLSVPEGQYLTDIWIGKEGVPEGQHQTDYLGYSCFTVKREAIIGIVLKKNGHKDIPRITW